MSGKEYFLGLDCGTTSVGWAVSDAEYRILKAKGKRLWGVRLFEGADTAEGRRLVRSSRRRTARTKRRLKLLEMLFREEMAKVDPDFSIRLRESFFVEEHKRNRDGDLGKLSKKLLGEDIAKYFEKNERVKGGKKAKYPTIWHLRKDLMAAGEHRDIRLYFLAIHHILKNRGHFLIDGEMSEGGEDFAKLWQSFVDEANRCNILLDDIVAESVEKIILDRRKFKRGKQEELAELIFSEREQYDENDELYEFGGKKELAGLLVGSKVDLVKIFGGDEKFSYGFADGVFEDKEAEIAEKIGDGIELMRLAKRIYDFVVLKNLLKENKTISEAMVSNYDIHQSDLAELKKALKPFADDYAAMFKTEKVTKENYDNKKKEIKEPFYNAYIGNAYLEDKKGRKKTQKVDQAGLNRQICSILEKNGLLRNEKKGSENFYVKTNGCGLSDGFVDRLNRGEALPKQKGQARGAIPMQLHRAELRKILANLGHDFPSFAAIVADEDEKCNTKCKKLEILHSFRIPYYVGPLVERKFDEKGNLINEDGSGFSWGDEEINEIIYPWNFDKLINKGERANAFIRRMTNECTYLIGEDVLPKCSMIYQKYMLLNELNNLKVDNNRIADVKVKQDIYARYFAGGENGGKMTLTNLKKWLVDNRIIDSDSELSGVDGTFKAKLSTEKDFKRIFGEDDFAKYNNETITVNDKTYKKLEYIIELTTILGEEKAMLKEKVASVLGLAADDKKVVDLSKLNYKDWAKFSEKLLTGIKANIGNREVTVLDALWETNQNFMKLVETNGSGFKEAIEKHNEGQIKIEPGKISYEVVKNSYCSPSVKRALWQSLKIVDELVEVQSRAPEKIFIEVARDANAEKERTSNRKKQLEDMYSIIKSDDAKKILEELKGKEDRDLQNKKLYLYFTQMGKCMYSGEKIELDDLMTAYDIDHIYPRSKTKDDSLSNNLVLVKAEYNRIKGDRQLCQFSAGKEWQSKRDGLWKMLKFSGRNAKNRAGLITEEKYNRLVRQDPLTDKELGDFIARQIVETRQSTKALAEILKRVYPGTKVVYSKAEHVSDFRHLFGGDRKDRSGNLVKAGMGEFIKIRELNDYHHAKDAYLNIVVGNVYHSTFNDPWEYVANDAVREKYSINDRVIFRESERYKNTNGVEVNWPLVKGWGYADTIEIVRKTLGRNDILWTRMTGVGHGEISKQMIVGKGENNGKFAIKIDTRLQDISKYGGYNSANTGHFVLIEVDSKKGGRERRLVTVPIMNLGDVNGYISRECGTMNPKIIMKKILLKSYLRINGFPIHLTGKTSDNFTFWPAVQVIFDAETDKYIKKIVNVSAKIAEQKKKKAVYDIKEKNDGVSKERNEELFKKFVEKLKAFEKMPKMKFAIAGVRNNGAEKFSNLGINEQCEVLAGFLNVFGANAMTASWKKIGAKTDSAGAGDVNNCIDNFETCELIYQSPTGLYERKIDLKTVCKGMTIEERRERLNNIRIKNGIKPLENVDEWYQENREVRL